MTLYQIKRDNPARMAFWERPRAQTFQTVALRPAMSIFSGKAPFALVGPYIANILKLNHGQEWILDLIFDTDAVLSNGKGRPWLDPLQFGGNYVRGREIGNWLLVDSIREWELLPPNFSYENYPYLCRVVTVVGYTGNKVTTYSDYRRGRVLVPFITKGETYIELSKVTKWSEGKPLEDPVYGLRPTPYPVTDYVVIAKPHTKLMRKPTENWLASGWKIPTGDKLLVYGLFGDWGNCGPRGWVRMSDVKKA